jgi:hypothetical protein
VTVAARIAKIDPTTLCKGCSGQSRNEAALLLTEHVYRIGMLLTIVSDH